MISVAVKNPTVSSKLESENYRHCRTTLITRMRRYRSRKTLYTAIPSQNLLSNPLRPHQYCSHLHSPHRPHTTSCSQSRHAGRPGHPPSDQNCIWTPHGTLPHVPPISRRSILRAISRRADPSRARPPRGKAPSPLALPRRTTWCHSIPITTRNLKISHIIFIALLLLPP